MHKNPTVPVHAEQYIISADESKSALNPQSLTPAWHSTLGFFVPRFQRAVEWLRFQSCESRYRKKKQKPSRKMSILLKCRRGRGCCHQSAAKADSSLRSE